MGKQIPVQDPRAISQATFANELQASASGCTVYGVSGFNSKVNSQYIQIHDASATPIDTAVPKYNIKVPADSNFAIDFGLVGMPFRNGVYLCNSSTPQTKTIGLADCQFFMLQTLP